MQLASEDVLASEGRGSTVIGPACLWSDHFETTSTEVTRTPRPPYIYPLPQPCMSTPHIPAYQLPPARQTRHPTDPACHIRTPYDRSSYGSVLTPCTIVSTRTPHTFASGMKAKVTISHSERGPAGRDP